MITYSEVKRKIEDAVEYLIQKTVTHTGYTLFKGLSFDELTALRIEIIGSNARPEIIGSTITGNWTIDIDINVVSNSHDKTRAEHYEISGKIGDMVMSDEIVDIMNNMPLSTTGITIYPGASGWMPDVSNDAIMDGEYVTTYRVVVYCSASVTEG